MTHIGDDAALFALGLLDADEARAVEMHARTCSTCAAALSAAEDDVTALAEADVQHGEADAQRVAPVALPAARRVSINRLAVAAAFIVGLLPSAYFLSANRAMHDGMETQQAAIAAIASQPHRDVAFAGNVNARVMYGMDGSWYCIVLPGTARPMHVMWKHDGTSTDLGETHVVGDTAMLYLPRSHRMDQLELVADQTVVGKAQLVF